MQSSNADRDWKKEEVATFAIRLGFFVLTLLPMAALLMPWVTLDGTGETHTGVSTMALLASPVRVYLYEVAPIQAVTLILGPALIALLAIITSHYYYRRKSIAWAWTLLAMLAIALYIPYGTTDLANATHGGLIAVISVAVLLMLHQAFIRIQVALQYKRKWRKVCRALEIATGIGYYPRRHQS